MLQEPERIAPDRDVRLQLFALFHDVWAVVHSVAPEEDAESERSRGDRLQEGLAALPAIERQVLLLVSLEGFSYEGTGLILGLERDEVRTLLHTAQEEMQRQTAASVLIIEDEHMIAMDLARIIEEMGLHPDIGGSWQKSAERELADMNRSVR